MKILLLKTGTDDGSQNEMPSLGMAVTARRLKDLGHEVTVYDGHLNGGLFQVPGEFHTIMFSAVSFEWEKVRALIKANPFTKIVLGGPHAYSYHDIITKKYPDITVVVGESDTMTNEHINTKGVVFLPHASSEELLAPDYSDFYGKDKMKGYSTYISRGCTNVCSFCQSGKAHGKFRVRDNSSLFDEFASIKNYPCVRTIHIVDDAFTADIGHAKSFLEFFLEHGYERIYKLNIFNVRADQLDSEILGMMKRAGVVNLPIGVESADPIVYKAVGKGESLNEIKEGIKLIQESGIVPWLNMIIGLPFDTWERTLNSIEWVESIPAPKIVHWFVYSPFRGTKAYQYYVKRGIIKDGYIPPPYGRRYDNLPWDSDFETPDFTFEERRKAHLYAYLKTKSPILVNSNILKDVISYGFVDDYLLWLKHAPLKDYIDKELPKKHEKEQV